MSSIQGLDDSESLPLLQQHQIQATPPILHKAAPADTMGLRAAWRALLKGELTFKHVWGIIRGIGPVLIWSVVALIGSVGQGVELKQVGNAMPTFAFFIFWFSGTLLAALFFLGYLLIEIFTNSVTPEMRRFPHWKMAAIGVLSTANGVLVLFPNALVPGIMQALLGPTISVIPFSMIMSMFFLRRCYSVWQVLSVLIILGGCVVAVIPAFTGGADVSQVGPPLQDFLFFLSAVPISLASVLEEVFFENSQIHMAHLLAWSGLYQAISIFFTFPLMLIPAWKAPGINTFGEIMRQQLQGLKCFAGSPIPPEYCCVNPEVCCDCSGTTSTLAMLLFIFFYIVTNVGQLGIIKEGNAVFSFVVSALSVPLSEFAFAMPFIMGKYVESLTMYNYIALAVLLIGTVLYRVFDFQKHEEELYVSRGKAALHNAVVETHTVVAPGLNSVRIVQTIDEVTLEEHDDHIRHNSLFYTSRSG